MDINEKDETKDREGKFIQNIHKVKFNKGKYYSHY